MSFTKQLIAASAIALLGTGAFAQEATPDTWLQAAKSTQSRADVSADLAAGDGRIDPMDLFGELLRLRHAGGAEVDDERFRMEALDEAAGTKDDLLDDVGHGQIVCKRLTYTNERGWV